MKKILKSCEVVILPLHVKPEAQKMINQLQELIAEHDRQVVKMFSLPGGNIKPSSEKRMEAAMGAARAMAESTLRKLMIKHLSELKLFHEVPHISIKY